MNGLHGEEVSFEGEGAVGEIGEAGFGLIAVEVEAVGTGEGEESVR